MAVPRQRTTQRKVLRWQRYVAIGDSSTEGLPPGRVDALRSNRPDLRPLSLDSG